MAEKLTKELLQGKKFTKTINVEVFGEPFELDIKPLNGPEAQDVEADMQAGVDMKGRPGKNGKMEQSMAIEMKKNNKGQKDSSLKACAYGTVDENFTLDVIKSTWPNVLIEQVAKQVKELSGIGNQEEVERFRNEGTGSGDVLQADQGTGDTAERGDESQSVAESGID